MSGIMIVGIGIGLMIFSVILFMISVIYRKTAGRKIRKELREEYEE